MDEMQYIRGLMESGVDELEIFDYIESNTDLDPAEVFNKIYY